MIGNKQATNITNKNRLNITVSFESLSFVGKQERIRGLVALAETAYLYRRRDRLAEIADQLVRLNDPTAFTVGLYYKGLSFPGEELEQPKQCFELASESNLPRIRSKSLLFLGSNNFYRGDFDEAMRLYSKSFIDTKENAPTIALEALRNIAAIQAITGSHNSALRILEENFNLAWKLRTMNQLYWYHYVNSYAEELRVSGQTRKAFTIANELTKFPIVGSYPGMVETIQDCHRDLPRSERDLGLPVNVSSITSSRKFKISVPDVSFGRRVGDLINLIDENSDHLSGEDIGDAMSLLSERANAKKLAMQLLIILFTFLC